MLVPQSAPCLGLKNDIHTGSSSLVPRAWNLGTAFATPGALEFPAMSTPSAPHFNPRQTGDEPRNWGPMVVGLVLVVIVIAGIVILGRNRQNTSNEPDPYAANLQVGDIHPSTADNFVGSTVTYLDLQLTNKADKTLVGGQVQVTFKNSLGQAVQTETLPLHVLGKNQLGGYEDVTDISMSPIGPGQTKTIRLTLEHISSDWNQSYPDMKFVNLKVR
jgi:hypothetical protein